MTYPKITLKPKSWAEDSTIELDYEDAKEIWEQLKRLFEPVQPLFIGGIQPTSPAESATKTSKPCRNDFRWGGRLPCDCPKCSRMSTNL